MTKETVRNRIEELLSREYACSPQELNGSGTIYSTCMAGPHIRIMAYRQCVVVCTSGGLRESVRRLLWGRNRDEIFELPLVYGQTIHYVPEPDRVNAPERPSHYGSRCWFGPEVQELAGLTGFENAVEFDVHGAAAAKAICAATDGGRIIGVAGASESPVRGLLEMGVDVLGEYRNAGLASHLVGRLTRELLAREMVPFYSASVTNIGSQMVAGRCGYIPAWVDTFGTVFDDTFAYKNTAEEFQQVLAQCRAMVSAEF